MNGAVYRLDADTIVKIYREGIPLKEIDGKMDLAKRKVTYMNEERNEKLNEVDEVLDAKEMTDDEAENVSGGILLTTKEIEKLNKMRRERRK